MTRGKTKSSNQVLVVHGRSDELNLEVVKTIKKIGLDAVVLHEDSEERKDIIEELAKEESTFAVFLLNGEDVVAPRDRFPREARIRSCQEIVYEMGYAIGKLGQENIFVLYNKEGNFAVPVENQKIQYVPYDEAGRWQFDFIKCLKQSGFDVDANKLL